MAEIILKNVTQEVSEKNLDKFYQKISKSKCKKEEIKSYLFEFLMEIKNKNNEQYYFLLSILLLNSFKYISSLVFSSDMTPRSSEFYDVISSINNISELEKLIDKEINDEVGYESDLNDDPFEDISEEELEEIDEEYSETELTDSNDEKENIDYYYEEEDQFSKGILEDMFYFNQIIVDKNKVSELIDYFCFCLLENSDLEKKMLTIFPETRTPLIIEGLYYFSLIKEFSLDGLVSYYIKSQLNQKVDKIKDIICFLNYYNFSLKKEYGTIISDACREYYKYFTYILAHDNSSSVSENSINILEYIEQKDMISIVSRCNYDMDFFKEIICSVVKMMAYGIFDKNNNPIPCDEVENFYNAKTNQKTKIKFIPMKN